jgi:hypothetical protein
MWFLLIAFVRSSKALNPEEVYSDLQSPIQYQLRHQMVNFTKTCSLQNPLNPEEV